MIRELWRNLVAASAVLTATMLAALLYEAVLR
jgi:hypothetical protein